MAKEGKGKKSPAEKPAKDAKPGSLTKAPPPGRKQAAPAPSLPPSPPTSPPTSAHPSSLTGSSPTPPSTTRPDTSGFDGFGDDFVESRGEKALKKIEKELVSESPQGRSWRIAANMVNRYRPVPQLVWPIVHAVYGRPDDLGEPDPMTFSAVEQLIIRAAQDKTLLHATKEPPEAKNLAQALKLIGSDVAAAICLVHAVCRKITTTVNERVSRPILDDALLRTHIGFHVGSLSENSGAGRGMIAGFAGRCGLSVQIAAGENDQASRALSGMASGQDMSEVCTTVYGCDPLEVAALSLITGGCCREIAFGISSYSTRHKDALPGTEQYRWLALFTVIEGARMGQVENVPEALWRELGYDPARKSKLREHIINAQRRGHGWQWLTQQQLVAIGESLETKARVRGVRPPDDSK